MNTIITTLDGIKSKFNEGLNKYCSVIPNKSWIPTNIKPKDWIEVYTNNKIWAKEGITEEQFNYLMLYSFIENYYNTNATNRSHNITNINILTKLYSLIANDHIEEAYTLIELDQKTKTLVKEKFLANLCNNNKQEPRQETQMLLEKFNKFSHAYLFGAKRADNKQALQKTIYKPF